MAPVIREFESRKEEADTVVCVAGRHGEMLDQVLDFFAIVPDIRVDLTAETRSLAGFTAVRHDLTFTRRQ
jgi:UDP-N-acetylglucosamine 2-epimerase (non-hydrolysing)